MFYIMEDYFTFRLHILKHWFNEEIKRETKNYLKTNKNMTFQNLWDAAKTVLRGKLEKYRPTSRNKI